MFTPLRRRLPALLAVAACLLTAPAIPGLATPAPRGLPEPATDLDGLPALESPLDLLRREALAAPEAKIDPALRADKGSAAPDRDARVRDGSPDAAGGDIRGGDAAPDPSAPVHIVVRSAGPVDLRAFDPHVHAFTWPEGEHLSVLRVPRDAVARIAALPGVARVESGEPVARVSGDTTVPAVPGMGGILGGDSATTGDTATAIDTAPGTDAPWSPEAAADLAARMARAPRWAETAAQLADRGAAADRAPAPRADGWHDVGPGHGTRDAWDQGFTGEGVTVAVLDTGVDFGHPDLHDAWRVLPAGHPYGGWPQAYDPGGVYNYMLDTNAGSQTALSRQARSGIIQAHQTSAVVEREVAGTMRPTACFRPLKPAAGGTRVEGDEACDYVVPESKSGRPRLGHHPDGAFSAVRQEFMGVLVVDAETAGVYDTVYVDLDGDHDFTDEKPATKASPLAWRDVDGDAVADLSGGLLYYIADGTLPVPGAYLWGIEDRVPAAGTVVALFYDTGNHGTLCATSVVSRGRLGVPPEVNLRFEDLPDGQPAAVNPGGAPDAHLVPVIVFTGPTNLVIDSAWRYVVLGHDPARDDDAIQLSSNSYVFSGVEDGGWSTTWSRPVDFYTRKHSPSTIWTGGTGNGGPGYGTTMPPLPLASVKVAGTTQTGSTGMDSIARADQITFGDIVPFSNRGPTSDGRLGPDVAADGANAAGGIPINLVAANQNLPPTQRNGLYANVTWGGTSRSGPAQAGNLALVYQAFKHKHGRWPKWEEAQAILMAGARFNAYDPFATGAGTVDAGDATRIAAGTHGVYAMPPKWTAGGYGGRDYPAFTKLTRQGAAEVGRFTLTNPSDHPIEVALSAQVPRRIGSYDGLEIVTNAAALSSPPTALTPDYLVALPKDRIPAGTELMAVRAVWPLDQADTGGDMLLDRAFALIVYQHTDRDGDGKLWEDRDGNGVVNHAMLAGATYGLDRAAAVDYANSEIDQGEYARFASTNQHMSNLHVWVQHPLERWKDGIHIGLYNTQVCQGNQCQGRGVNAPNPTVRLRVDFYRWERWDWLALDKATLTVPAGGQAALEATLRVPGVAPLGAYQGAIFADYARGAGDVPIATGGGWELPGRRLVIPVNASVAARYDWRAALTLGGPESADPDALYDNGSVYGTQSWTWRAESGDWRHFFVEMAEPDAGTMLVTRTTWEDSKPGQADIDTRIWGPAEDTFTTDDPDFFGPHGMTRIGQSPWLHGGRGNYAFQTSSGGNDDWVSAPAGAGLHEVTLHNVRSSGTQFQMPFEVTVGALKVEPAVIRIAGNACRAVRLTTGMDLPRFEAFSAGLSVPSLVTGLAISQTPSVAAGHATHDIRVDSPPRLFEVTATGRPDDDIDLYVLYDRDGDGVFNQQTEVVGTANGPGSTETIALPAGQPAGRYQAWVHGSAVAGGDGTFDLRVRVIAGDQVHLANLPAEVKGGQGYTFDVCVRGVDLAAAPAVQEGIVAFGPGGAPGLVQLAVEWVREPDRWRALLPALLAGWEIGSSGG